LYLGIDPRAPRLLMPTTLTVDVAMVAFEAAILRRAHLEQPPMVVLPTRQVFSATDARTIDKNMLRRWAGQP
jgi:hypothetical protein